MARRIKPTDLVELLTENIQRSLSLADLGNFSLTGAYLSMALDRLGDEARHSSLPLPDKGEKLAVEAEQREESSLVAVLASIQDVLERIEAKPER